jgi:hypothetical protein
MMNWSDLSRNGQRKNWRLTPSKGNSGNEEEKLLLATAVTLGPLNRRKWENKRRGVKMCKGRQSLQQSPRINHLAHTYNVFIPPCHLEPEIGWFLDK